MKHMYNSYLGFDQTFQLAHFFIELNHGRMVSRLATQSIMEPVRHGLSLHSWLRPQSGASVTVRGQSNTR